MVRRNHPNKSNKVGSYGFKGVIDMAKKAEFEETLLERQERAKAAQKAQGATLADRERGLVSMALFMAEEKFKSGKIDRKKLNVVKGMAKKNPKKLAKMVENSLK